MDESSPPHSAAGPGPAERSGEVPLQELLARLAAHPEVRREVEDACEAMRAEGLLGETPVPGDASTVGPYRTISELGRGGQGIVYLAEDTRLHRKVALKVLTGLGPGSEKVIQRFRREAEVASRLDHPGICGVHDAGVSHGIPYMAMQLVEGESLAERIAVAKQHPDGDDADSMLLFSEAEVADAAGRQSSAQAKPSSISVKGGPTTRERLQELLRVFEKTARALHAAHEAGVIHRDIKPGNVMVTKAGNPVILDFGLARAEDEDIQSLTRTGDLFGTPAYMSPEQLTRGTLRLDRRTDVYSLGATLYECLTLKRLFEAPTREALYQAIMSKEPEDPRRLNRAISADLRVVIETALAKDRDKRYQTALELAEEIQRLRSHEPIVARPVGSIGRLTRWARRRPALAASLTGLFVALVIGTGVSLWMAHDAQGQKARAEEATKRANLQAAELQKRLYTALVRTASTAMQEGRYDLVSSRLGLCLPELRGWEWNWLTRTNPQPIASVSGNGATVTGMDLSSDGRFLSVSTVPGGTEIRDLLSGRTSMVLPDAVEGMLSFDGRLFLGAIIGRNGRLGLWNARSGTRIDEFLGKPWQVDLNAFDAVGKRFILIGPQSEMSIHDAATGRLLAHIDSPFGALPKATAWSDDDATVLAVLVLPGGVVECRTWNAATGAAVSRVTLSLDEPGLGSYAWWADVPFSIDVVGKRLVTVLPSNVLGIVSMATGKIISTSTEVLPGISRLNIVPGTDYFIPIWKPTTREKGRVPLWSLRPCRLVGDLASKSVKVHVILIDARNGRVFVAAGGDIEEFPLRVRRTHIELGGSPTTEPLRCVQFVRFSPDGSQVVAGGSSGRLRIWDRLSGRLARQVLTDLAWVSPHFSNEQLVPLGFDGIEGDVIELDPVTGSRIARYGRNSESRVPCVATSPDGKYVASTGWDGSARLFDRASREQLLRIEPDVEGGLLYAVKFSPDGRFLGIAGAKEVTILDLSTGAQTQLDCGYDATALAFSPDSRLLVTGGTAEAVDLWDLSTMMRRHHWVGGHTSTVWGLCFSPDGSRVASGDEKGQMTIWRVEGEEAVLEIKVGEQPLLDLSWSPDGEAIAAVDESGMVTLWEESEVADSDERDRTAEAYEIVRDLYAENGDSTAVFDALNGDDGLDPGVRVLALDIAAVRGEDPLELARVATRFATTALESPSEGSSQAARALTLAVRADERTHHRCPEVLEALACAQEATGDLGAARKTLRGLLEVRYLERVSQPLGSAQGFPQEARINAWISDLDSRLRE